MTTSIYSNSMDNTDPSIIYSTGWDLNSSSLTHSTSTPNSYVTFKFDGSEVAVRCTIPSGSGEYSLVSYSVQGERGEIVRHDTTSTEQSVVSCWRAQALTPGEHIMEIRILEGGMSYTLDRIDYGRTSAPVSTDNVSSTASESVMSTVASDSTLAGSTPTATSISANLPSAYTSSGIPASQSATPGPGAPIPIISMVAASTAGMFFVLMLFMIWLFRYNCKKSQERNQTPLDEDLFLPSAHKKTSITSHECLLYPATPSIRQIPISYQPKAPRRLERFRKPYLNFSLNHAAKRSRDKAIILPSFSSDIV